MDSFISWKMESWEPRIEKELYSKYIRKHKRKEHPCLFPYLYDNKIGLRNSLSHIPLKLVRDAAIHPSLHSLVHPGWSFTHLICILSSYKCRHCARKWRYKNDCIYHSLHINWRNFFSNQKNTILLSLKMKYILFFRCPFFPILILAFQNSVYTQ